MEDDEPELAGYEPHERPLRGPRLRLIMRITVILGLVALVLPGILVTMGTANRTAIRACAIYAAYYAPEAIASDARFDLVSEPGAGWNCYVRNFDGTEVLLTHLGLIPGAVTVPSGPVEST